MNSDEQAPINNQQLNSAKKIGAQRVIDSKALLQGEKVVLIQHGYQHYQLRSTKENKLILTK